MERENPDAESDIIFGNLNISKFESYKSQIDQLLVRISQYPEISDYLPYINILPLVESVSHYGEAVSCTMLGIAQKVLDAFSTKGEIADTLQHRQIPNKIMDCLLVHECLHIIFSEGFQYLYAHEKELLSHFVSTIIPDSINQHRPLSYNKTFIREKQYRSIAGSIYTPDTLVFLSNYFGAFKKNMIQTGFGGSYLLPFSYVSQLQEYLEKDNENIEDLYSSDPDVYIEKYLTGIHSCKKIEERQKSFDDLYEEEGFVNYLAGLITGVDIIHEMNPYFPQDQGKLNNIRKLQERNISKEECFAQVKTRKDIRKLYE